MFVKSEEFPVSDDLTLEQNRAFCFCAGLKFGFAFVEASKTAPENMTNVFFKNMSDTCKLSLIT